MAVADGGRAASVATRLDLSCPAARLLVDVHDRRARIALGLHGSRLESVVREQREVEYALHLASCARCQAHARACSRCGRDPLKRGHSFWCRLNEHRWRKLFARLFPPRAARPRRVEVKARPEDVLGVRAGATLAEAREAFRTLAKRYHPDLWAKAPRRKREEAGRRMREVNEAYESLCKRLEEAR